MNKIIKYIVDCVFIVSLFFFALYLFFLFNLDDKIVIFEIDRYSKMDTLPTNETYESCKNETDNKFYIQCIHRYFNERFYYKRNVIDTHLTDEWTGDCVSATIFYKNLLDKRKISNEIIVLNRHAFNIIDLTTKEGEYCILDQIILECY